MILKRLCGMIFGVASLVATLEQACAQPDTLKKEASWSVPSQREIRLAVSDWINTTGISADKMTEVQNFLLRNLPSELGEPGLGGVIGTIQKIRPELTDLVERIEKTIEQVDPQLIDQIFLLSGDSFVERHLRLFAMDCFIRKGLYDEALAVAKDLEPADVIQPQVLLLARAIACHQLVQKGKCVIVCNQLLENGDRLPKRFVKLAELIKDDIEKMNDDSLDEIARMMNDVGRRISLYRAGKEVLDEEQAVLEKLDKLIQKIEEQKRQSSRQSQLNPGKPMEKSQNAAGKGSGDVVKKNLSDGGNWGDLPLADKVESLAEMTRDLPPHYRAIVEEYFKNLAKQQEGDVPK